MQVIRSNQLEALVDELARIVRERPLPPHASEMIVVPGTAMRQWLPLELARRLGIWAHASLPSPRAALQTLCNRALGRPENQSDVFDAHELKWAVASTLHELRGDERLRDINHYIDDADRLLRFSSRVAQLFDRYVVYRPQLVLGWERREADGWQPLLWRRLIERHGSQHLAARIQEVGRLGDRPANAALPLPERIMLFGIDSLPPLFLQGFTHLSHLIETTLFNPSPTAEYWGDLRPKRELFRGAQGQLPFVDPADAGNDAEIHPLLASLGRSAREFHEQLSELQHEDCNRFVRPHQPTKLHSLQRSFLTLVANEQSMWRKEDASVQVHRCTNAWREVQVLYDHLRDFLEQDPTLEPHDITVVIPDLDAYESIVEAVFSEVPTPDEQMAHPIPYQLPNSRRDAERVFINHVSAVFKTLQGQLRVADVLDVLTIPTLAAEFQFDHSERELIGRLLAQAAVDWGADAKHRAQLGAAEDATHSWEAGLQRLLLALLLPSDRRRVFEQTVATAIDAEQASTVLPRLMTCIDHINRARAQTKGTRTVAQWASIVDGIIADLFTKSETTSSGYELINATQATLLARSHRAGFEAELTFDSYTRELLNAISASRGARSRANGVRFCTAEPVNLLPARVVCFLGLSEGDFPRAEGLELLDLARGRCPGDRSRQDEDRHTFLNGILTARERLYISYVSAAAEPSGSQKPSSVVEELMQSLSADHAGGECETIHPLHPYDADYFGSNSPLFSYSHRYLQVAQAQQRGLRIADVHTEFAVDTAEEATTTDLTRWLWHPARALFREHLGVDFEVGANPLRDRLVHTEDPLRAWAVANDVLDLLAQDVSDAEVMAYVKHTPDLTTGSVGAVHRAQLLDEIARFETVTAGLPRSETTRNETSIAGMRLRYQVELNPKGVRTAVRFVRGGRRYDLQVWIEHLLLGVAQKNFTATLMVCRSTGALPQRIGYAKVEDSVTELERIVALYQQARRERLPLLPGASRVYAEARHTGRGHDDALHKAHKAFLQSNGAVEDRYIAALWPEGSPFVEHETAFADCAMQLYAPLLHHQRLL